MMTIDVPLFKGLGKSLMVFAVLGSLAACSTNPATGEQQFTALMSPQQEIKVGAQEHQKVLATFGAVPSNDPLQLYLTEVGQKIAVNTERPDVQYKFFLLDSPVVNAFAIPGGYVYATRGLMALANSEAELASVLAHEVGHITGRHSAERYSQGVVTSLGAVLLSAALDSSTASQALGVGSNLFLSSYSRGQENEADMLGVRYLHNAGYDQNAMASFLANLDGYSSLEDRMNGRGGNGFDFFSTHPQTADRVGKATAIASQYPATGNEVVKRNEYLRKIDGMIYGDSSRHGFARGNDFYHPEMGFMFSVPDGFKLVNQPTQVIATSQSGAVILFDAAGSGGAPDPAAYLTQIWMKGEPVQNVESILINGMRAATGSFPGKVNNVPVTIRLIAVEWENGKMFRFQMAIPQNGSAQLLEELKRTTYSLRRLSQSEASSIKPYKIGIVTAKAGDTVASLARRMPFNNLQEERFRALNALNHSQDIKSGEIYKIVVD